MTAMWQLTLVGGGADGRIIEVPQGTLGFTVPSEPLPAERMPESGPVTIPFDSSVRYQVRDRPVPGVPHDQQSAPTRAYWNRSA